jgi:hypothetical protein
MLHRRVYVVAANYMVFFLHVSTSNENAWPIYYVLKSLEQKYDSQELDLEPYSN